MRTALGVILLIIAASATHAATINLDFEGVNATYPSGFAFVDEFYNGGTSSDGTSGTNFGVAFSSNAQAICLNSLTVNCSNTSRGGQGFPNSGQGGLFFLTATETFLNVAAGFDTGFSFFYTAIRQTGSVEVYDGIDGTGTLLATLALGLTPSNCAAGYNAEFCPFVATGIAFSGTAKSVSFAGVANQILFDDVTFGSVIPIPIPAAVWLFGSGLGLLGWIRRRQTA